MSAPSPSSPAASGWRHLPGLDGLRGLAVLAVVLFHLDERWLPGGFLGVDVFFALSGYLITALLLAERAEHGRIDLGGFWARRARRLLPALLLLLLVMAALLPGVDPVERGRRVPDLLAALAYVANWQLIREGTPYFSSFVDPSPMRHLWSLAIEEQFYLAWPLVVALVRSRAILLGATVVGIVASAAAMAVRYDPGDPSRAYFGTDARVHQVLIGALAATILTARPWQHRGVLPSRVGLISLAGLAWMAWTVDGSDSWYYRGGSVLAGCLTVGVILGAGQLGGACSRVLSFRPLTALGLISYGVYLWHWPVIVLLGPDELGQDGAARAAIQAAVAVGLAWLSYVLLERPIRRGRLGSWTFTKRRTARLVPTAMGVVAVLVLVAGIGRQPDPLAAAGGEGGLVVTNPGGEDRVGSDGAPSTPDGAPQVRSIAVVGDSVAYLWTGGLAPEAASRGLEFVNAAIVSCQVGYEQLYSPEGRPAGAKSTSCADSVPAAHRRVRELAPDVVLWHDLNASFARKDDSGQILVEGPEWEAHVFDAWDEALAVLQAPDTTVVILLPPWRSVDPAGCDGAARRDRCEVVQDQDTRIREATKEYLARHAGDQQVVGIDVDDLVCPAMPCPVTVEGIQLRIPDPDLTHFTGEGMRWLAPKLIDRTVAAAEAAARR